MSTIQFTKNYDDLSTDRGYQFKFFCDRCGNGYLSSFESSMLGTGGGLLRAAGSLFGGVLGRAGDSAYEVQRAIGGKAHDAALRNAVEEVKPHFRQCKRCGQWVCPEVCWNHKRGLCLECAPDLQQEMAAAQAQATKDQVWEKAAATDYVKNVNMQEFAAACCPNCGAQTQGGKFCPECGQKILTKARCPGCGAEYEAGAKFCPECGRKLKG